jgi:hypothetical protein
MSAAAENDAAIEEAFLSVWQQSLVEKKRVVAVGDSTYSVRKTPRHHLAQLDYQVNGLDFRGLEQNPQTKSRWAAMARQGAKVMQFLRAGQYVAVVADGKIKHYRSIAATGDES